MVPMWLIWLAVAVVLGIVEVLTLYLLAMWFAIGSLVAMILALLGATVNVQLVVALIISVVLLLYTRPIVTKFVKVDRVKTGIEQYAGKIGIVIKSIDNVRGEGLVKLGGEEWNAISADDTDIKEGTKVKILEVRGAKLVVSKED